MGLAQDELSYFRRMMLAMADDPQQHARLRDCFADYLRTRTREEYTPLPSKPIERLPGDEGDYLFHACNVPIYRGDLTQARDAREVAWERASYGRKRLDRDEYIRWINDGGGEI